MTASSVEVRLVSVDDVAELTALPARNQEFLAPWDPLREEDYVTEAVQGRLIVEMLGRHADGLALPLVITDGGRILGRITVNDIVRGPFQSAHLGYWVSEDRTDGRRDRGRRSHGRAGVRELWPAPTAGRHSRAQPRLAAGAERNGFTLIGLAPRYLQIAGRWQDHLLFQRVAPS